MQDHKIEAVLDGLIVAVFIVDKDQIVHSRNAASVRLFGTGIRGHKLSDFIQKKKVAKAVTAAIETGERATVVVRLNLVVPTSFRVSAMRLDPDDTRTEPMVVVSFEDISHIREAEQMRSDFVANVSHELRSPLTALYGFIETLQGPARNDPDASSRFLELMQKEAARMARLIDDLLSLSKLQSEERYAHTEAIAISPIVRRVVASLAPILEREQVVVDLDLDADLEPVFGDADELTQVFSNLIENAAKYSKVGAKVTIKAGVNGAGTGEVFVSIEDQGEGIAAEHISRLTERFYRIDKGRSRDKGGTGLGLAIVKHILMRHRGRLDVTSKEGKGSCFTVILPKAD